MFDWLVGWLLNQQHNFNIKHFIIIEKEDHFKRPAFVINNHNHKICFDFNKRKQKQIKKIPQIF